jgi:hypothetical protein
MMHSRRLMVREKVLHVKTKNHHHYYYYYFLLIFFLGKQISKKKYGGKERNAERKEGGEWSNEQANFTSKSSVYLI